MLLAYSGLLVAQTNRASGVNDFEITITFFEEPLDPVQVYKAPLRYNKDFALILQMDDGSSTIYEQVMPFFKGQAGNPGLFFGDGAQGNRPFKMDAVHYSFNGLGVDMHNYHQGFLNWNEMETLWAAEFGIVNHGFTDPPTTDLEYEVRRNISYTRRKTSETIIAGGIDMNTYVVPGTNAAQIPIAKQHNLAVYHQGVAAIENPARVESLPPIQGVEISRGSITNNLFQDVQAVANLSGPDNHYIATYFNHGFNPPDINFAAFQQQLNQIADTYGLNGSDRLWSASSTEVFEYLRIKELVTVNTSQTGNVLTITFSGNDIPDNYRYYALSIVVEGESNIISMDVQQPDDISTYSFNQNKALINMAWNGKAPVDLFERAENAVTAAESQTTIANALTAMDYVIMLPDGDPKEALRERLCALPNMPYEAGFCLVPNFLGDDFEVCEADTIVLEAPEAESYQWSTGQTSQSISFQAVETIEIWASITDNLGNIINDTVLITVNPLPIIVAEPEMAEIAPGEQVTLTASGADEYLWSNGSTSPQITVSPDVTTTYIVTGTSLAGCSSTDTTEVVIVYNTTIDFTANTVCLGDTSILISQIFTDDSILAKEWDLDGDGVFEFADEVENDTLKLAFEHAGEKLIGMRLKTQSGAIHIKYHQVIVADYPVADFEFEDTCEGEVTRFTDKSTLVVGNVQTHLWFFDDGNVSLEANPSNFFEETGEYETQLIVISAYGCSDTISKKVEIVESPDFVVRLADGTVVQNNEQLTLNIGDTLHFQVAGTYDSVFWMDEIPGNSLNVINGGDFYVTVYRNGCHETSYFTVIESDVPPGPVPVVDIMNLISPNADGINDYWVIKDLNAMQPAKVVIYNRSGKPVYQSNDYKNDWSGTYNGNPLPEGTYFFIIEGSNGEVIKGPLSILR
jgi:gliding motility-associated-like protein